VSPGPVTIDPPVFSAASSVLGQTVAGQLAQAAAALGGGLAGSGAMAGSDPGGVGWASSYDQVAPVVAGAVADLANACHQLGALLEQTGFNHASAEASSDPNHAAPTPPDTTNYSAVPSVAAPTPPSANGGSSDPPHGWGLIKSLVGYVWPNGDPGRLRDAGRTWTACANALRGAAGVVPEAVTAIQGQHSPEVADAVAVCQAMGQHIDDVAGGCDDLARGCHDYAEHLDKAHHDIIKELEELVAATVAIEATGAVVSVFSFGAAEVPTQIAETGRIAATAVKVGGIISRLIEFAGTVGRAVAGVAERIGKVVQRLLRICGARLSKATTEEAKTLSAAADDAEASAEKKLAAETADSQEVATVEPKGFHNQSTAQNHFQNHGSEFGYQSLADYQKGAQDFLKEAEGKGYPVKIDLNGRIRIYDPATNRFGAYDSDGSVVTYFKPTSPSYWERNSTKWGKSVQWK
jgi:hypothetical protein